MATKVLRKIVHIDENKCNGCGACVPVCVEGALRIVDGKARLIREQYCDGLGACLGECPQGAITIEDRWCEDFDEDAVKNGHAATTKTAVSEPLPCGCPSASVRQLAPQSEAEVTRAATHAKSRLSHWPVQLRLVPPGAPFLQGADLLLTADCVPFAYSNYHQDFMAGHAVLVACPKLDDFPAHQQKLTQILRQANPRSLTVVHMEVPCCSGLAYMAQEAIRLSGKNIPFKEVTIGVQGEIKSED